MTGEFDKITLPGSLVREPDANYRAENDDLESARIRDLDSNRRLREGMVNPVLLGALGWSAFIAVVVVMQGFLSCFYLESTPLASLIGTVPAVVGILGFIIKGLFQAKADR